MRRPAFGFIVDHPKRDLPGAISFARAAVEHGCDAYLVPFYEQASDVPLLPLDALIVNFARPANLELVKGYCSSELPVFVLDTEGGTLTEAGTNTPDRLASAIQERGFSRYLSGYFFWGERLREAFVEHSGMPADTLVVSGCPRFDYASPRWRAALEFPADGYVLVNASYPLVNPLFVRSESSERAAAVAAGWDDGYMQKLVKEVTVVFHAFQDNVARLAADLPDVRFLVRPHPFENAATYKRRFSALRNVTVNGAGSALNAIANARCLVHLNCQTAVEAIMLDKLPISMEYLNTPRMLGHAPLPSRISAHADSYEQLLDMVRTPDTYASRFPFADNYHNAIYPWFHANDGRAGDRVVEHLLTEVRLRSQPISVARSLAGSRSKPRTGQRAQSLATNVLGSLAMSRLRAALQQTRADKIFTVGEVAAALKRMCQVEKGVVPKISTARHPITGLPLASIACRPA